MDKKKNYKITVLMLDQKIETNFYTQKVAIDTIIQLKKVDSGFLAGILEEKIGRKWEITWSLK